MLLEHTVKLVVEAEAYCRVSLKLHSLAVSVEIYTCNNRILKVLQGLAADYRGHDRNLHRSQPLLLGLVLTSIRPECIILFLKSVKDLLHRCCPIHLVCVRKHHGKDILRIETIARKEILIIEGICYGSRVNHHLHGYLLRQDTLVADCARKRKVLRCLPAKDEHSGSIDACRRRLDHISARLDLRLHLHLGEGALHALWTLGSSSYTERVEYLSHRHVRIHIQDIILSEVRHPVVNIVSAADKSGNSGKHSHYGQHGPQYL